MQQVLTHINYHNSCMWGWNVCSVSFLLDWHSDIHRIYSKILHDSPEEIWHINSTVKNIVEGFLTVLYCIYSSYWIICVKIHFRLVCMGCHIFFIIIIIILLFPRWAPGRWHWLAVWLTLIFQLLPLFSCLSWRQGQLCCHIWVLKKQNKRYLCQICLKFMETLCDYESAARKNMWFSYQVPQGF